MSPAYSISWLAPWPLLPRSSLHQMDHQLRDAPWQTRKSTEECHRVRSSSWNDATALASYVTLRMMLTMAST